MANKIILEKIIDNIDLKLPIELQELDLNNFGINLKLFDYQTKAMQKIQKYLYYFFNNENLSLKNPIKLYRENGLDENIEKRFNINRDNENFNFMSNHYPLIDNSYIEFNNIINRAGFWMATGSGKTVIMIKLIELLFKMAKNKFIPQKDILILAPNDTILNQIKKHTNEFNKGNEIKIELKDLRDWEKEKHQQINLFSNKDKITVFYFKAGNIREENKEALIDYKTYLNDGNWYLILDEAHKGDNEFSKSQQYYNVLSKNGFLFNFSATFVDELDIATTIYNFNLERFISQGYGKHLKLTNQEFVSFRKNKDIEFSDEERQKIVLKSIVTYTAIKKLKERIKELDENLFHNPLMVTVANSVNTMDADLKIFFKELANIAQGDCEIDDIKSELIIDYKENPFYYFKYGEEINSDFIDSLNSITKNDILKLTFNAKSFGTIEIITISNNSKEVAFKLTTSSTPFALLVVSEATKWSDNILEGYSHSKNIIEKSYFNNINDKNSNINILMGSRIFTEGWDSNRPNIINFINFGVGDAQKLVLQTIGRGVRINPYNTERKRIEHLDYKNVNKNKIIKYAQAIQSLFIFSTNKEIIKGIIDNLDKNTTDEIWVSIKGFRKNQNINNKLIKPVIEENRQEFSDRKFKISKNDFKKLESFLTPVNSKIALVENNIEISTLNKIFNQKDYFSLNNINSNEQSDTLLLKINRHFKAKSYSLKDYAYLENEDIQSYKKIQIKNLAENELLELEQQIKNILENKNYTLEELAIKLQNKEITTDEFIKLQDITSNCAITFNKLNTNLSKTFKEHYYNPIFIAKTGFGEYFKNIIKEESEITFLKDLIKYIETETNELKNYDWWYFSKIVENVDNIKIPYFNSKTESTSYFYPDFVFWLKKDNNYYIKFIDPKGTQHPENAVDKIEGFEKIFNKQKIFENLKVDSQLYYYNNNEPISLKDKLEHYWTNDFAQIFRN